MKFFPLKIAIACLFIAPLLYVLTLGYAEKYIKDNYTEQIQNALIGDSESLLNGSVRLEERIAYNIDTFLQQDEMIQALHLKIKVRVTATSGKILYPIYQDANALERGLNQGIDRTQVAKINFGLLNDGFTVAVESNISHGSRLANIILIFYLGTASVIFFTFYQIGSRKAAKERQIKSELISKLQKEEESYRRTVDQLSKDRQGLFENIKILNARYQESREKAKTNEDELFDEIISLEKQLKSFIQLKQEKENEISELKSQIQKVERRKSSKSKRNEFDFCDKRFRTVYKNIDMHRKAVSGYLNLNEDQQIKAEETIHQLDSDSDKIVVKRKVFVGKKHKAPSFEVLFAYNGRLYFRKIHSNRIEVLVIGTKNTQQKDMEFLHGL